MLTKTDGQKVIGTLARYRWLVIYSKRRLPEYPAKAAAIAEKSMEYNNMVRTFRYQRIFFGASLPILYQTISR